jgi:hypothetical protein
MRLCPPLVALAHRVASIADQARHSLFTYQRAKSRRAAYVRILAARFASELSQHRPRKARGRREGRVLTAPMVRLQTKSRRRHHRYEPNNRPSLRDGLNGVLRALPGDRAFLPPSSPKRALRALGI